ncbi:PspA/IM30 family protein [Paenibacillus filicis]|uniref:PspA/IM30 family protein n=1 Tax=Paenibacillus filicis TaxID=669464 RepID=A0ABU9DG78_9BACL
MGILARFREIMASNIHALLDKTEDPERTIDDFMRGLNRDLGQVKAETASVLADERRTKRALDDCQAEIAKLQRYAEKAVEAGNDGEARKFLERKVPLAEKEASLQAAYDLAASNAASMKRIQDKLISDIGQLEARQAELKGKLAATRVQQRINAAGSSVGGQDAAFQAAEEKVNSAYEEAMALAELRGGQKDDLDELLAQYDRDTDKGTDTGDELAAIKEKLKKKE